ncbi:MAG: hypothetical protein QM736_25010 [Vicinamibacterales bacterium]
MRYVTTHGALAADTHAQRPASVSLRTAMLEGLAPDGGLYVPESIEPWRDAEIARLPERTLTEIAYRALRPYTRPELDATTFEAVVAEALNFPIPARRSRTGHLRVGAVPWSDAGVQGRWRADDGAPDGVARQRRSAADGTRRHIR